MKLCAPVLLLAILLPIMFTPGTALSEEALNEVFLIARSGKLLAFSGIKNKWFTKDLHSGETVAKSAYDGNVAIAFTGERALAFSGITGRWVEKRLRIRESVVSISAEGNVGTIITDIRALGFSATKGAWVESQFTIDD